MAHGSTLHDLSNSSRFLNGLRIAVSDTNRLQCKFSGQKISAGDLVVVFTVGGAKGEKPTSQVCSLKAVSGFIINVIKIGSNFQAQKINGFKGLPRDLQVMATKLLACSTAGGKTSTVTRKRPASTLVDQSSGAKRVKN